MMESNLAFLVSWVQTVDFDDELELQAWQQADERLSQLWRNSGIGKLICRLYVHVETIVIAQQPGLAGRLRYFKHRGDELVPESSCCSIVLSQQSTGYRLWCGHCSNAGSNRCSICTASGSGPLPSKRIGSIAACELVLLWFLWPSSPLTTSYPVSTLSLP
jgi:hypothetical protein